MPESWSGGCQCGAVRYELAPEQIKSLHCCHCRECQRQSASAFGMSMTLPRAAFKLLRGNLKTWQRGTDSGNVNRANFCPTCGVRIFHDGGEGRAEISVKAGSLDDTAVLVPTAHIWTRRAQPWVQLPGHLLLCAGEPDSDEELYEAYRSRHG